MGGIPFWQGSISGPLLNNISVYDLFSIINNGGFPSIADDNRPYVVGDGMKQVIQSFDKVSDKLFYWLQIIRWK